MNIQVDFYKDTGKWYAGGEVEIKDDTFLWSDDFKRQVIENQKILRPDAIKQFYVVTASTPANDADPAYKGFFNHLWKAGTF